MNKTVALLECLVQLKEAQSCADALLSDIVADAVRVNKGKGGIPQPATLKAFRNALKSANTHCYQAELILAEFDAVPMAALQSQSPMQSSPHSQLPSQSVFYST